MAHIYVTPTHTSFLSFLTPVLYGKRNKVICLLNLSSTLSHPNDEAADLLVNPTSAT